MDVGAPTIQVYQPWLPFGLGDFRIKESHNMSTSLYDQLNQYRCNNPCHNGVIRFKVISLRFLKRVGVG